MEKLYVSHPSLSFHMCEVQTMKVNMDFLLFVDIWYVGWE